MAVNVLGHHFAVAAPDLVWAADLTYVWTGEGWVYVAVIVDVGSRRVVGWALAEHMRTELPLNALAMALGRRLPAAELLHHCDRGSQYASAPYRRLLAQHAIRSSMSRKGNCWDNAIVESFWATLKTELVHRQPWPTRRAVRLAIVEYIESYTSLYASRLQGMIWCVRTTGCSSISGLFVQDFCLLAPMEFADPRLILLKGFSPSSRCRLSGSQSDLFAITPCRTLRNLSACHFLCQFFISVVSRA